MPVFASEKQINFIIDLTEKRDISGLPPLVQDYISNVEMGYPEMINKNTASRMIDFLLSAPWKKKVSNDLPDVPAGRYAVEIGDKLRFFHVNRPTEGKWHGYTFVNEQAGPELFSIRDRKRSAMILDTIKKDEGALARYGQELGICGMCGFELTNELSREIGLGPTCRKK